MILVGAFGARFGSQRGWMKNWIVAGCLGSGAALVALAFAAGSDGRWPLPPTVFALGFANGVFAVAAIGSMMGLAGAGHGGREGVRMGVFGAAQAIAFAAGGFLGASGVDALRALLDNAATAFLCVFLAEAALFVAAAVLASRLELKSSRARPQISTALQGAAT